MHQFNQIADGDVTADRIGLGFLCGEDAHRNFEMHVHDRGEALRIEVKPPEESAFSR